MAWPVSLKRVFDPRAWGAAMAIISVFGAGVGAGYYVFGVPAEQVEETLRDDLQVMRAQLQSSTNLQERLLTERVPRSELEAQGRELAATQRAYEICQATSVSREVYERAQADIRGLLEVRRDLGRAEALLEGEKRASALTSELSEKVSLKLSTVQQICRTLDLNEQLLGWISEIENTGRELWDELRREREDLRRLVGVAGEAKAACAECTRSGKCKKDESMRHCALAGAFEGQAELAREGLRVLEEEYLRQRKRIGDLEERLIVSIDVEEDPTR